MLFQWDILQSRYWTVKPRLRCLPSLFHDWIRDWNINTENYRYISVPYNRGASERVGKSLHPHGVKLAHKPAHSSIWIIYRKGQTGGYRQEYTIYSIKCILGKHENNWGKRLLNECSKKYRVSQHFPFFSSRETEIFIHFRDPGNFSGNNLLIINCNTYLIRGPQVF